MTNNHTMGIGKAKGSFVVSNDKGLHTRPSTELVKCAVKYKSKIHLVYHSTKVDAKSLLGILALAASKGTRLGVEAEGIDAEDAVNSILDLAKQKFRTKF